MLKDLIAQGFGNEEDYNCAEKIINGANIAYQLHLTPDQCRLMAGFGGGMGIGSVCGALASGVAVLSYLFVQKNAHESDTIKRLTKDFLQCFEHKMGSIICTPLKEAYYTEEKHCKDVIFAAAVALDEVINQEMSKQNTINSEEI